MNKNLYKNLYKNLNKNQNKNQNKNINKNLNKKIFLKILVKICKLKIIQWNKIKFNIMRIFITVIQKFHKNIK